MILSLNLSLKQVSKCCLCHSDCLFVNFFCIPQRTPKLSMNEPFLNQKGVVHANNNMFELENNMDGDVLFITKTYLLGCIFLNDI